MNLNRLIPVSFIAASVPFFVIASGSTDTVYRGVLTASQTWPYSGESVSRADFSALRAAGTYVLAVPGIGQYVATRVDGVQEAGVHEVMFDGSRLASGVYFYTMRAGNYAETRRLVILR